MDWIARGLGLFYLLGGVAVIQAARRNRLLDQGLAAITLNPTPRVERIAAIWFLVAGVMTALSGLLLLVLSHWAVAVFVVFWTAQAAYLAWVHRAGGRQVQESRAMSRAFNALMLWTLATLFVIWIDGAGRLH